jgi:hypothetical protein
MITRGQVIDLLKLSAVYDQRTVADVDVQGWLLVGQRSRWTSETARRAIVDYYSAGAEQSRITPARISDDIRAARRRAAATFQGPVMPGEMTGAHYVRWYRAQLDGHVDALMARWADGHEIPAAPPVEALGGGTGVRAIREQFPEFVAKFGQLPAGDGSDQ